MNTDNGLNFATGIDTSGIEEGAAKIERLFNEIGDRANETGEGMQKALSVTGMMGDLDKSLRSVAAAAGVAFSVKQAQDFAMQIMHVRGEFQKLEVAFSTILGSAEKADALMAQMVRTAATTPFGLSDVAGGAKQLLAYGLEAEKVNETLIRLGDIAAGLSIPLGDIVYLYGTTMAQGRLYTQDLNQFTGRGIPMIRELAAQFGVAESRVKELVEEGKVGFPEVQKVIENLTKAGGMFGGLMEAQSKTISGQISNIQDAVETMFNDIGRSSEGAINTTLKGVSYLVENYETVATAALDVAIAFGSYKAALVVLTAVQAAHTRIVEAATVQMALAKAAGEAITAAEARQIATKNLLTAATKRLTVAVKANTAAMLTNPYVLAASAIAALVYTVYKLATAETAAEKASRALADTMDKLKEKQKAYNDETAEAVRIANDDAAATADRDEALSLLIKRYPDIIQKYIDEKGQLKDILALKKEIADYDANRQKEETTETLRQTGLDAYNNHKAAETVLDLQKRGRAADPGTVKRLREAYEESSGNSGSWASITTIRDYFKDLAAQSKTKYERNLSENAIEAFTAENGALAGYSDEQLQALKKKLQDSLSEQQKKQDIFFDEIQATLNTGDRESLLSRVNGMITARTAPKATNTARQAALLKELQEAEKALKAFDTDSHTEYTAEQAENKRKELQTAVDNAKKAYKDAGGTDTTKETARRNELQRKLDEETQRLQIENQAAEIALMQDGRDKKLREIQADYDARIRETRKKAAELAAANKEAGVVGTATVTIDVTAYNGLTDAQAQSLQQSAALAEQKRIKSTAEAYQAETAAMRQYLAQYGTYQEQKLAIAEEYAEKIRKAATEGERLTLERQRDSALSKLDLEHLKENIDWETIFNDIDVLSLEYLEKLKEQLQDALKAGTIQAEDAKTISEQIQRINEAIVEKQKEWRANFGLVIPELEEIRRREREALEAEEAKNLAQEKLNAALIREKRIRQDIVKLANGKGIAIEETDVITGNQNSIFALFQDAKEDTEVLSNLFSQLAEAESNTATSTTALANASSTAAIKTQAAAGGMASTVAIIDKIIHTVNDNIQSANSLFEKIGVANTQFGEGFASFAESSQYATSAWESLKSGNAMGVIDGVVGSIQTLGKSFESWFGFSFNNSNSAEVAKITARLTESNEALRRAIDKLKDRITDSYGGAKSITAGQEALAAQKQVNSQTMEILRAQMGYHSAHHSNAYYWGLSNKDYQSINATLAQYATNEGKTASRVYSLADIYKLTPEEMDYIRTFNIDMWNKMLDQGKYDKSEYWEQFADLAGEIEEIENALKETLTQTSFDSLRSSFVDTLMDMDASAEDFADDFSEYMMRAVLNAKIADMLDGELDKFYDSWADATESGNALTETEINRLNEQWQDIVNRGIAIRDQAAAITGYDSTASTSQSASTKGFQSMGQETADELNGRFTALQIAGEKIASLSESTFAKITEMAAVQVAGNTTLTEMRNLMISSNSFLEDIARYSKKSYTEFGPCLEEIRTNTKALRQ